MKWIENGIQFEGTVAEFIELHNGMDMAPIRKRTGHRVILANQLTRETVEHNSLKDAAEYLTQKTGTFISPKKLAEVIGGNEQWGDYRGRYADDCAAVQGELVPQGGGEN